MPNANPTPTSLPTPDEVLWTEMRAARKDVQLLHPLLDLLTAPEGASGTAAVRLIALLVSMKEQMDRIESQVEELGERMLADQREGHDLQSDVSRLFKILGEDA
jgi:hypothetical protein